MTVQEVAKAVMKVTSTTQWDVANKNNLSGQGAVGMFLKSKSMRVDNLLMILNTCGYELVARSPEAGMPEFIIGGKVAEKAKEQEADEKLMEMVRKAVLEEMSKSKRKKE